MDAEADLYPVPSLCPAQPGYYGLARYHGAVEFQVSEAGPLNLLADNSSDLITIA